MHWHLEVTDDAKFQIRRLDKSVADRVVRYMLRVATLQSPTANAERLKGQDKPLWRWRVGAYRVIAEVDDGIMRILVVKVGHRREVYR